MADKNIFSRVEIKYLLTLSQRDELLELMKNRMVKDPHGRSTIRNIYYDTESFILARRSIEKPVYKEKLRVRSYTSSSLDEPVYVELKKKCKKTVFKRRIIVPQRDALNFLSGSELPEDEFDNPESKPSDKQIAKEIKYFRDIYKTLRPVVFLSYDRQAYFDKEDKDFRITFDTNIRYRTTDLSLEYEPGGELLLDPDKTIMEIKLVGGMPLWLSRFLSDKQIFKASFSKYGNAYKDMLEKGVIKIGSI